MTKEDALRLTTLKEQIIAERDKLKKELDSMCYACCEDSFSPIFMTDQTMKKLSLRDYNTMIFTICIIESLLNDEEEDTDDV